MSKTNRKNLRRLTRSVNRYNRQTKRLTNKVRRTNSRLESLAAK